MVNLVIDKGNSSTKVAVFNNHDLLYTNHHRAFNIDQLNFYFDNYPVKRAIISTVKNRTEDWEETLKQKTDVVYFNAVAYKGINNKYLTPQTLGADRLAAV